MKISYLVLDVDGTLTDGKIYMGPAGEVCKAFDIKDGCGIHDVFPAHGGQVIVMTARNSEIVRRRCEELNITRYYQGVRQKDAQLRALAGELGLTPNAQGKYEEIAYMGDDIIDLPVMALCGCVGTPRDGVDAVKAVADFISTKDGGDGAVREFIEFLCR